MPSALPPGPTLEAARAKNKRGIQLAQAGRLSESVDAFRKAIQYYPEFFDAFCNLGNVLTFQKKFPEALRCYRRALELRPGDAGLLNNLSNLLREQGDYESAAERAREALAILPNHAGARNNLGAALQQLGKLPEAIASFETALALSPGMADVLLNLAGALWQERRYDQAASRASELLRLQPGSAMAHTYLGLSLAELGQFAESEAALRESIRLSPGEPKTHRNLAFLLLKVRRFCEAESSLRTAIALDPVCAEYHAMLGVALAKQGCYEEALRTYSVTLQLQPKDGEARMHHGIVMLLMGNFERGWDEYEWRLQGVTWIAPPAPYWDGGRLDGRTILLHAEQGIGDTFQFIRYAPLVKEKGGTVVLRVDPALIPLLSASPGIDRLVPMDQPVQEADVHIGLMSLPHRCGTRLETIPAPIPYIFPDARAIERWRRELAATRGLKVGVVWKGNPDHPDDCIRSLALQNLEPLASIENVTLLSLQRNAAEEIRAATFPIEDLAQKEDATRGSFMDSAGLIRNLDLLITCDTSVAHLAGAMGVPVWILLAHIPDWRWMLARNDSPWYPCARLFRQTGPGNWQEVIQRVAGCLREKGKRGASVTGEVSSV